MSNTVSRPLLRRFQKPIFQFQDACQTFLSLNQKKIQLVSNFFQSFKVQKIIHGKKFVKKLLIYLHACFLFVKPNCEILSPNFGLSKPKFLIPPYFYFKTNLSHLTHKMNNKPIIINTTTCASMLLLMETTWHLCEKLLYRFLHQNYKRTILSNLSY